MKKKLEHILVRTLKACFEQGDLSAAPLPDYTIEVPNNPDHGHFATNLPMTLASSQSGLNSSARAYRSAAAEYLPCMTSALP